MAPAAASVSLPHGFRSNSATDTQRPLKELPARHSPMFGPFLRPNARSIALGAHRGMGKNVIVDGGHTGASSGWRENTIKSFLKAAECGASFIEFDVQVTKDGVPIVWHDDFITFGDAEHRHSAKIRDLTFEEFHTIGHRREQGVLQQCRTIYRHSGSVLMEWKIEEEDELPSLEQVFHKMPAHIGFNIEIKMLSNPEQIQTSQEEIDFVISAVVRIVDRFQHERPIVFSSFDPDVAKKLKHAQSHTTMFLSEGETEIHSDPRRTSLQAAMEWACMNGLDGIVLDSNAVRQRQEIVREARARGLIVMTYGTDNDDHGWVIAQFCLGVHGAIVDDVAGITRKLSTSYGDSSSFDYCTTLST